MKRKKRVKTHIGYAEVGSHGGIFMFDGGSIADRYPSLLHIYRRRVAPGLVKVRITEYPSYKRSK